MTALGCLLWASIYLYLIAYRVCLCSLTFSHTGFISHLGMYPAHFVLLPFNHHSFFPGHFLSSSPKNPGIGYQLFHRSFQVYLRLYNFYCCSLCSAPITSSYHLVQPLLAVYYSFTWVFDQY